MQNGSFKFFERKQLRRAAAQLQTLGATDIEALYNEDETEFALRAIVPVGHKNGETIRRPRTVYNFRDIGYLKSINR